ncbi:galectin-10-like [Ochotona princeps]|uniref:galectin-10-like n=1 Tax=Ochotona princeps TaxID=9978 RepID=UPI002714FDA9|nr:galectin-10-like [Ochotona princeps]
MMSGMQVPYTRNVSLCIGSSVTIRGAPANCFRKDPQLQVDFHTGTSEKSDIAFHLRVYFGHCVVMNSLRCGGWDCEVKYSHTPFTECRQFELCIMVLHNEYQVVINGQHCYSFAHRVHPASVRMIQVWRDVYLTSVDVR